MPINRFIKMVVNLAFPLSVQLEEATVHTANFQEAVVSGATGFNGCHGDLSVS